MARAFSQATIVGNVGRDPEMRYTPNGTPVTNFSVAVNRKQGEQEFTDWYNISCWGRQAEVADQYVTKGMLILVSGELSIRQYTSREGENRTSVQISANTFQMLSSREEDAASRSSATAADDDFDDEIPFD